MIPLSQIRGYMPDIEVGEVGQGLPVQLEYRYQVIMHGWRGFGRPSQPASGSDNDICAANTCTRMDADVSAASR